MIAAIRIHIVTFANLLLSLLIPVVFILSCNEGEDTINYAPQADFICSDNIDHFKLTSTSQDANGDKLTVEWISTDDLVAIQNPFSSTAIIYLPELAESRDVSIGLIVDDGQASDTFVKNITLPKTTVQRLYGLGIDPQYEHANNVNYNWYYDQMNTGAFSLINCGPASVTMAIKWTNPGFMKTPEDARNFYRSDGGWWYTNDVVNYLDFYSVDNHVIDLPHIDTIRRQIDLGNIVILCLDVFYIRSELRNYWHVDKFYTTSETGWGHFIVIKGYQVVDDKVFYEAYDPYSLGVRYSDNSLKGENRFYRSEDLNTAVSTWWKYAIVISKNASKSAHTGLDINRIIHKPGL